MEFNVKERKKGRKGFEIIGNKGILIVWEWIEFRNSLSLPDFVAMFKSGNLDVTYTKKNSMV
jgi:hypothetical protein